MSLLRINSRRFASILTTSIVSTNLYSRCDGSYSASSSATYPANSPSEDRHIAPIQIQNWTCAAVFDGHGGWNVSEFASNRLVPLIEKQLSSISSCKCNKLADGKTTPDCIIDAAIIRAFEQCESEFIESIRPAYKLGFGKVASVGSCVLVALKKDDNLVLANCGDCRAVLGSTGSGNLQAGLPSYFATRLTRDHNARVPLEVAAMQAAHPDESLAELIRCKNSHACYVKGRLQLTRALGDLYLKHAEFNAPAGAHRSAGRHIPAPFNPPYVNYIPEVVHVKVVKEDKFVILASDGLWDFLTDEEAVAVVAKCEDKGKAAEVLVEVVLTIAASRCGLTLEELKALPQGDRRRSRHDDTTAVVMYF